MKILVCILFFLTCSTQLWAQENLITNGGFENIDSCYGQPADIGFDVFEWSGCHGWSNPIASSSDLWCQNPIISTQTPPNIPGLGYQYSRTGENMTGLLINDGISFNYREYIQNELSSTLELNKYYHIEFYISGNVTSCSASEFGVKFFSSKYWTPGELWLTDFVPDAVNDISQYFLDTAVWQKVEMTYLANGSENFVIIGNFQDSLSMTYVQPCDTSFWGNLTLAGDYFFIDDVSITELPGFANIPNVFTPNNDGVNDLFEFQVYNCNSWKMDILNRWGNHVISLDSVHPVWDGKDYEDGVYFYKLYGEDCSMLKQGFISMLR